MSLSDIKIQLQELYGADISESLISNITNEVMDEVKAWQSRPLEALYPIVYFDCIVVKVRQDKRIINKSIYVSLGVDISGRKDILGLWISENEGSKFWLNNLTEMKNRGLLDILVACTDNLTGMSQAINAVYPKTDHQLCIVHQIRNSLAFVSYKHRKAVAADLKPIYTAATEDEAHLALEAFENKWNKQYPHISKSWYRNWDNLVIFLQYPKEIRKVIYTTNAIERIRIKCDGNVGIGKSDPEYLLDVNGESNSTLHYVHNEHGEGSMGPLNSDYFHFETDRERFYFNKPIVIGGTTCRFQDSDFF